MAVGAYKTSRKSLSLVFAVAFGLVAVISFLSNQPLAAAVALVVAAYLYAFSTIEYVISKREVRANGLFFIRWSVPLTAIKSFGVVHHRRSVGPLGVSLGSLVSPAVFIYEDEEWLTLLHPENPDRFVEELESRIRGEEPEEKIRYI